MDDPHAFPPFHRWDEVTQRRVLVGAETHAFRTGKVLFYQGDRGQRCFLVLDGSVRSLMYRSDETSLDLGTQGPGDWIGLPELVLGGPYLADAVALESCRCLAFDRTAFARLRAAQGGEEWLTAELARRCYALHARIELAQPGQRLARWLIEHGSASATIVSTQDELAAAVGTSRETVNRHLGRMQAEGLVKVERGRITVLDADGLVVWGGE